jgi:hypothetical protein
MMRSSVVKRHPAWGALCMGLLITLSVGCAGSRQPRGSVVESGFLGNYAQLEPGKSGQAKLVYFAPDVDWNSYHAILLDSVTLWPGKDGSLAKISPEDQQRLANTLYKDLHVELAKHNEIVKHPGPGVLRIRAALTEASPTNVPLNAVATFIPQIRTVTTITGLAANTALTVGEVSGEVDITDSLTGRRLAAAVDKRVGQRSVKALGTWSQVDAAFDAWAKQLADRIAALKAGKETD